MEFKPLVGLTPELFITLANTLVLFLILRKLLFKPVMKIMDEREEDVKNDIEHGKRAKEEGLKFKSEYETKVGTARSEGQQIVEMAKRRAEEKSSEIISQAKHEAENIKTKASADIEKERKQAYNDVKGEISSIALLAASKVIEKEIDKSKHEELIDEFIKDVGDAK